MSINKRVGKLDKRAPVAHSKGRRTFHGNDKGFFVEIFPRGKDGTAPLDCNEIYIGMDGIWPTDRLILKRADIDAIAAEGWDCNIIVFTEIRPAA